MIEQVMALASHTADQADAIAKSDATTALRFVGGDLQEAHYGEEVGINLRVVVGGRVGSGGTTSTDAEVLVENALASARLGEIGQLYYPEAAPAAVPVVFDERTSEASVDDLEFVGALLGDELASGVSGIDCHLERSVGQVRVVNSRGVDHCYPVTGVALSVQATRTTAGGQVTLGTWWGSTRLPSDEDIAGLAHHLKQRFDWADRLAEPPSGRSAVCLTPRAVAALVRPLRQALRGKALYYDSSPLADRMGHEVVDRRITLLDDPLLDGRPGSRPVDDEGVVCRRLTLIRSGVLEAGIYDLETAALAGVPATGHGRRVTFGKPQAAFSNLRVLPGEDDWGRLLEATGDGLIIDGFHGVGQGFSVGGRFQAPASLALRVHDGTVIGRVPGVRLAGNVFGCLNRVLALGSEAQWLGSASMPPMVVEGIQLMG